MRQRDRCMKNELRRQNKEKRAGMTEEEVKRKSLSAAKILMSREFYKTAKNIMLYMPLGKETNTEEIIKAAFDNGKKVVFPVTDKVTGRITPYYATQDAKFQRGAFSVNEPVNTEIADIRDIDLFVVPGIAFDKNGVRVGFGKGCYDRLLQDCAGVKVGFCYDFQICETIISDEHDIAMDYIVTESRFIDCTK